MGPNIQNGEVSTELGEEFTAPISVEVWHRGHDGVLYTGDVLIGLWSGEEERYNSQITMPYEEARQLGLRLIESAADAEELEGQQPAESG